MSLSPLRERTGRYFYLYSKSKEKNVKDMTNRPESVSSGQGVGDFSDVAVSNKPIGADIMARQLLTWRNKGEGELHLG